MIGEQKTSQSAGDGRRRNLQEEGEFAYVDHKIIAGHYQHVSWRPYIRVSTAAPPDINTFIAAAPR